MANNFYLDLITAQKNIKNPNLDGTAAYGTYSTIKECLKVVKEQLLENNITVVQMFYADPDRLVTRLVHISGEFLEDGGIRLYCSDKNNPQKLMAAGTYARRNGLCAMLSIAGSDDDDGQSATPTDQLPKSKQKKDVVPKQATSENNTQTTITVENIEDTMDDDLVWVGEQIEGFKKHKHLSMHNQWTQVNKEHLSLLKATKTDLYKQVVNAWTQQKKILTNEV